MPHIKLGIVTTNMNIAIFGATSHIAKDLISLLLKKQTNQLFLFVRNLDLAALQFSVIHKDSCKGQYVLKPYSKFNKFASYDIIINFIGAGDPLKALHLGRSLIDCTLYYDNMILQYLRYHQACKYIFLSSGAVYGNDFSKPVNKGSKVYLNINKISEQDWYQLAKLVAEISHRSHSELNIIDLRLFNYFSANVDLSARFFICDLLRCVADDSLFRTTSDNIVRDYLCKEDFYQIVSKIIDYDETINCPLDCYSKSTIDKFSILRRMQSNFGLNYVIEESSNPDRLITNGTSMKKNYYSMNRTAKIIGYVPTTTSLDCIISESIIILDTIKAS